MPAIPPTSPFLPLERSSKRTRNAVDGSGCGGFRSLSLKPLISLLDFLAAAVAFCFSVLGFFTLGFGLAFRLALVLAFDFALGFAFGFTLALPRVFGFALDVLAVAAALVDVAAALGFRVVVVLPV